jgi:nucleoside-diphosphate-sugar epimerase
MAFHLLEQTGPVSQESHLHAVLGASGSIGGGIIAELTARGIASRPVARTCRPGWFQADLTDPDQTLRALEGATHAHLCAGLPYSTETWRTDWPRIMENVIRASERSQTKLVFIDNVYMYGPPPLRRPITEDHPQNPVSDKGRIRKVVAEALLASHSEGRIQALILRAPDFYGPGATNSLLYLMVLQKVLQRKRPMWIGNPDRIHSFGHVIDISRAAVLLALDSGSYGQVWHSPTSKETVTARRLIGMIADRLGRPARFSKLGHLSLSAIGAIVPMVREVKEMAYQYFSDYEFSSEKFDRRYPSFKVTSYETGIAQMVDSFRSETR